ncbi:hypothetical protein [Sphingomonas lenta]|uniref:Uncharacterized protein n=1 Tax=Sphingomonas lenta TaxID=1141887 RepID=A0A2A2SE69_9SPHN|nr:hypothetical protein [Sphingomonas lenta]PAX07538.1 hypothetical protein CKY28_07705 [Sphingomonas lenta]
MQYFSRLSPVRAFKDLRLFFAERGPIELVFLVLAMAITLTLIYAFARDSNFETEYRPDIIYVEQYTLNRTDAEITAQQRIDQAEKRKRMAEIERRAAERQASFKRLDDKLKSYGF